MPSSSIALSLSQLDLACWATTKNFENGRPRGEIQPVWAAPLFQELSIEF